MFRSLSCLILCFGLALPALAAIDSVVVFPDRATVTRVVAEDVSAGSGRFVLSDLPVGLDRNSVRISASGPEGFRLGAFEFAAIRGSERVDARARELEARIQARKDERAALDDALEAREMQISLLRSLASGAGQGDDKLALDGWDDALRVIGEGAEEVLEHQRQTRIDQRELDREIERLERELADLGQQQRDTLELALDYASPGAGAAEFVVEYTVSGAAWRPVYEWRLDTESGRLNIVQSAEIRQRTGEDWSEVNLSLSLSRPSAGGRLPELQPWWVDVRQPQPERRERVQADSAMEEMQLSKPGAPAEWSGAELAGTEYTQRYDVSGRASVAGDNQANRFRLDEHELEASLSARAVPRRNPTAWLYATADYDGETALPPGQVTLYQDDALMGSVHFEGIAPGGELASSFGVDDRIEVEYDLIDEERSDRGMIRKSVQHVRNYRIEVTNGHSRPIDITVLDQMPVSRDERIEVELTDSTTEPDERDVDDKAGVLAWNRRLAAGGSETIRVGYQLTWPEDLPGVEGW